MLDEAVVTAADVMTRDVAIVHPETPLLDAVKLMASRRISGMPVVDDTGAVVGIVSEGDLVRWHEGYTEKQSRWLDMLAEGFQLAQSFLQGSLTLYTTGHCKPAPDRLTLHCTTVHSQHF